MRIIGLNAGNQNIGLAAMDNRTASTAQGIRTIRGNGYIDSPPAAVSLRDKQLSPVSAGKVLLQAGISRKKREALRDRIAASIFLQNHLDSIRR